MPVTTARKDTNNTAAAVNMTVSAVSTHSLVAGAASAAAAGSAMTGRSRDGYVGGCHGGPSPKDEAQ